MSAAVEPWWGEFFDDQYAELGLRPYTEEERQALEATVAWLTTVLEIEQGQTVLDQCCGIGRLSLPLARHGFRVVGVDLAPNLIKTAEREAKKDGLACSFHHADAFGFVAPYPCHAGFNWFTSFGYHRDDRVNIAMLERAFESLRPGAKFALDYVSAPKVFEAFRQCHLVRRALPNGRETLLLIEANVDFANGMYGGKWTFIGPNGKRKVRQSENRAYMPYDLLRLFENVGFKDMQLFGSPTGEPFGLQSPRCIVVARRP